MTLAAEPLLALLILALYLHDSAVLLRSNEALLERGLFGRWRARFATRRFTLAGRHVFAGSFLPPCTPLFRLAWVMEREVPASPGWEAFARGLGALQWASAGFFVLVVVLLPAALFVRAGDGALLVLIVAAYAGIGAAAALLLLQRGRLGLSVRQCLRMAGEMVLCPPVAANLARRVSLQRAVDEDFVSACLRLLPPAAWPRAAREIASRIADEIEAEDEGSGRHAQLAQRKESLP
ncbi:MAG: hypothetical protein V4864_24000 [Pseudomonadota bacterium]